MANAGGGLGSWQLPSPLILRGDEPEPEVSGSSLYPSSHSQHRHVPLSQACMGGGGGSGGAAVGQTSYLKCMSRVRPYVHGKAECMEPVKHEAESVKPSTDL